jgi:hypothetical protein
VDIGQTGAESWTVLADPEGNEFCVVRPKDTLIGLSGRVPARGSRRPEGVSAETPCEIIHEALPRKRRVRYWQAASIHTGTS